LEISLIKFGIALIGINVPDKKDVIKLTVANKHDTSVNQKVKKDKMDIR